MTLIEMDNNHKIGCAKIVFRFQKRLKAGCSLRSYSTCENEERIKGELSTKKKEF